ncbi:hypothetical protein [Kitasatospora sp. NPDC097691]|uniref:hypothetical protein n=1 Tax=Kitasatospora sp. NPDC097691 TaxID=3157231 RepID=UPI00332D7CCD
MIIASYLQWRTREGVLTGFVSAVIGGGVLSAPTAAAWTVPSERRPVAGQAM